MSGIGDIIAVAQLGYSLAEALKDYINEVGSVKASIKGLANEVKSTSHRVEELSNLIEKDPHTGFLTPLGLDECRRLSWEIRETIFELRTVLRKTNCTLNPSKVVAEEIDISKWKSLLWPFLKKELDLPRAHLVELKVELQLLMVVASAHKLSNMPLTPKIKKQRQDVHKNIIKLQQTKGKAASRYEKAKEKQTEPHRAVPPDNDPSAYSYGDDSSDEVDEEIWDQFMEFLEAAEKEEALEQAKYEKYLEEQEREARRKAEKEKVLLAQAMKLDREAEEKKRKEQVRKEVLEALAKDREEKYRQQEEYKSRIRAALVDAGVDADKIDETLGKLENPTVSEARIDIAAIVREQADISEEGDMDGSTTSEPQSIGSRRLLNPRKTMFRRRSSTSSVSPSIISSPQNGLAAGVPSSGAPRPVLEAWRLDSPRMRVPLPLSELLRLVKQQEKKNKSSVLERFMLLSGDCKNEFDALMEEKDSKSPRYSWQLVGVNTVKRRHRIGLFRYLEEDISVHVIIERQDIGPPDEEPTRHTGPPEKKPEPPLLTGQSFASTPLPSILKKQSNPDAPVLPKISSVNRPESHVRISGSSPEVGYVDHFGDQDSSSGSDFLAGGGVSNITRRPPTPSLLTNSSSLHRATSPRPASNIGRGPSIKVHGPSRPVSSDSDADYAYEEPPRPGSVPRRHPPVTEMFTSSHSRIPSRGFSRSRSPPQRRRSTDSFSRSRSPPQRSPSRNYGHHPPMSSIDERLASGFPSYQSSPPREYGQAYPPTPGQSPRPEQYSPAPMRPLIQQRYPNPPGNRPSSGNRPPPPPPRRDPPFGYNNGNNPITGYGPSMSPDVLETEDELYSPGDYDHRQRAAEIELRRAEAQRRRNRPPSVGKRYVGEDDYSEDHHRVAGIMRHNSGLEPNSPAAREYTSPPYGYASMGVPRPERPQSFVRTPSRQSSRRGSFSEYSRALVPARYFESESLARLKAKASRHLRKSRKSGSSDSYDESGEDSNESGEEAVKASRKKTNPMKTDSNIEDGPESFMDKYKKFFREPDKPTDDEVVEALGSGAPNRQASSQSSLPTHQFASSNANGTASSNHPNHAGHIHASISIMIDETNGVLTEEPQTIE